MPITTSPLPTNRSLGSPDPPNNYNTAAARINQIITELGGTPSAGFASVQAAIETFENHLASHPSGDGGGDGTNDHTQLVNRNNANQHSISSVTGLQTALDSKANVSHVHTISQVTGLQTALDGKASVTQVSSLQSTVENHITHTAVGAGAMIWNAQQNLWQGEIRPLTFWQRTYDSNGNPIGPMPTTADGLTASHVILAKAT